MRRPDTHATDRGRPPGFYHPKPPRYSRCSRPSSPPPPPPASTPCSPPPFSPPAGAPSTGTPAAPSTARLATATRFAPATRTPPGGPATSGWCLRGAGLRTAGTARPRAGSAIRVRGRLSLRHPQGGPLLPPAPRPADAGEQAASRRQLVRPAGAVSGHRSPAGQGGPSREAVGGGWSGRGS